nr:MAG TPA: hypothetical protein [Caudoviricetes sp.]
MNVTYSKHLVISYLHRPVSTRCRGLFRTCVRCIIVAIPALSYSMGTLPGMYLHLPARVVPFILHLCIQVDLHRTLVPISA